jgi:hypothetical protein
VGAVGVGITDPLDDGQLAALQQLVEAAQGRVQAQLVVDTDHLLPGETEGRAGLVIQVVGVGDDGVQTVVAAIHLDDNQDGVLAGLGGPGGVGQELRHDGADG